MSTRHKPSRYPYASAPHEYREGLTVRSHFRARWTGTIVGYSPDPRLSHCVIVQPLTSQDGHAIRKAKPRLLSYLWLEIVR